VTSGSKSKNRSGVPWIVRIMRVLDLTACVYEVHSQFFESLLLSRMTSEACCAVVLQDLNT